MEQDASQSTYAMPIQPSDESYSKRQHYTGNLHQLYPKTLSTSSHDPLRSFLYTETLSDKVGANSGSYNSDSYSKIICSTSGGNVKLLEDAKAEAQLSVSAKQGDGHSSFTTVESDTILSVNHESAEFSNIERLEFQPDSLERNLSRLPQNLESNDDANVNRDGSIVSPKSQVTISHMLECRGKLECDGRECIPSLPSILITRPYEKIPIDLSGHWRRLKKPTITADLQERIHHVKSGQKFPLPRHSDGHETDDHELKSKNVPTQGRYAGQAHSACNICCRQSNQELRFQAVPDVKSFDPTACSNCHVSSTNEKKEKAQENTVGASQCRCDYDRPQENPCRNVHFATVAIRLHNQTIGDNPSVSVGTPIAFDWPYRDEAPVPIDDFEAIQMAKRKSCSNRTIMNRISLNYYQRRNILTYYAGCSEEEIDRAERKTDRARRQRNFTALFSNMWRVEDTIQSAGRKVRRLVVRRGR